MKNFFKIAAAAAVVAPFSGAIAADNADVMAKLQQLEAIVQQQQAEITALRGDTTQNRALVADLVQEEIDAALDARIEEGLAAIKDSSSLSLGAGIDGLALTGEVRFRYEQNDGGGAATDGDNYGVRLRLGGIWTNKSDDTEIGVGVTVGAGGNSAENVYNGSANGNDNLWVDYAYAKHNMDAFSITVGQQINPFVTTDLLWDEDVRPVGITAGFEDAGFFATAGVILLTDNADEGFNPSTDAEATITAGQVGFKSDGEDANYTLALGYYHGNSETGNDVLGGVAGSANDYDVQILDLVGSFNTTAGDIGLGIHGHYAVNFGADGTGQAGMANADDEDQAYSIGITAGLEKLSAAYTYKHIENDAAIRGLNDNDFGRNTGSTNVEGHEIGVGYAISDNIDLGLNVFLYEQINGNLDGELYQLDLSYQF